MDDNPYSPPDPKIDYPDRPKGSPVKAVLAGAFVDIAGTLALSTMMGVVTVFVLTRTGMPPGFEGGFSSHPMWTPLKVIAMVLGTAMSVLAGFICARIARRRDYRAACILGAISVTAGLLFSGFPNPVSVNLLNAAVTFVAVLAGARLGMPKAVAGA